MSDVPEDDRIEKTVFIKAPREMSYDEMSDLIEKIKAAGANPIGLVNERPLFGKKGAEALKARR